MVDAKTVDILAIPFTNRVAVIAARRLGKCMRLTSVFLVQQIEEINKMAFISEENIPFSNYIGYAQ